jgi:hypothetical protein
VKGGEQKLLKMSASMVSKSSDASGSKAKSSRSAASDTSKAINHLAEAFAMSLKLEVVNPSRHSRTAAGLALKEDDNDLTVEEKVKLLARFAKDVAIADMYLVTRDDEQLRKAFVQEMLLGL